jgi:outer membrane protein assembly factor BamD (BamD/ComL family)
MTRRHFRLLLSSLLIASALAPVTLRATGDFYEEPLQTLADYLRLDQLPAKSFSEILEETSKPGGEVAKINYEKELGALTKKPGTEALASIDKMIAAARNEAANSLLSLLNDVRDLYTGPANAAETETYFAWRLEHVSDFGVSFEKPKEGAPIEERAAPGPDVIGEIERHLASASPALKPHWLYLRGAADYRGGNIGKSQDWFLKVATDFPKSPRAESALFMAARCQIWRSRSPNYTQQDMELVAAERPKAKKLFDEYFAKYPHGRLLGDALGWYGAFAFDGHDFVTALRCYAQQLDLPDHPELYDSAAIMVEKTLSRLASEPNDKAFAEVAKHPGAAQALVYLIINTSESDNYNGKVDSIDEVRGWRKAVLPRLAAALTAESKLYQKAEWMPRHLAMLAYAASGAGQQEQALKLLGTAELAAQESDDLLFARAVVLHRAKRPGEAVAALQTLLAKSPKSPLARGARLRLGLALTDDHQAGEAVLALEKLLKKPKNNPDAPGADKKPEEEEAVEDEYHERGESPILYDIELNQVRALIDTLLNFAPIEELSATAQTPNLDAAQTSQFTEAIAVRLLAREQFEEAKKFLTPEQRNSISQIEPLTQAAKTAKDPAARADACLKLGDAWAAARGKVLTHPLDTDETRRKVFINFSAEANVRRAESAPFVGAKDNFQLDLENRDELRHAFNWWIEASDAQPGTPLAAQALWRALKAMPQIADVSPFTFERAVARKWTETARKLYERLRTECPDSVEAQRYAVAWDFTARRKKAEDEYGPTHREAANVGIPSTDVFQVEEEYSSADSDDAKPIVAQLKGFEDAAGREDMASLRKKAEALRERVRKNFAALYDARLVNFIDDLALFFSEPDPGPEIRQRYVRLRTRFLNESAIGGNGYEEDNKANPDEELRKEIRLALSDGKTKPVADYFEFLDLAIIANHFVFVQIAGKDAKSDPDEKSDDSYRSHDYPHLAKATQAFLERYPKSKKREAALLLHARAVYRSSEQVELRKYVRWPQAVRWEGAIVKTFTQQEPFEPKRVLATLDAYDRTYPKGRYSADIRNYRAAVALRMHDWKPALELTIAQLDDKNCAGLHADAARRLGDFFTQLTDEQFRADLLPVIKANKRGRELLAKYAAFESDTNPLLYMRAWLSQQLAAKPL